MSIVKNETDKMPDEAIENRAKTYQGMMDFAYIWGLPLATGIVMLFTLLLLGVGVFNPLTWVISFFTFLGVMAFSKAFFVH
ncbi:hypothetical protein HK107_07715 [Parvularcula sp. ZS-1/3]|uniref:Aa3-type cytochrome c oxidase subunit IV n=1 Tax=Parvularcula mediterranea TaxID=2732508 RepID=A0A7Y3W4X0_9PROT|nr:hypothetical protein [Parvularcula mediterranea]NNU16205.1 hypothetical protein [Parvularcula mediterranea]